VTAIELILNSSGVLLDFDGVIVDSEQRQSVAWNTVIQKYNIRLTEPLVVIGKMDELIALSLATSEEEADQLLKSKREEFDRLYGDSYPPLVRGVKEFILAYHRIGALGITSNSRHERVVSVCSHYGLNNFFATIVTARGNFEPKPSPQVYFQALEDLGLLPQQVVAIEDSPTGFIAAKAARIRVVGIPTSLPKADIEGMADVVADSFGQIMEGWNDYGGIGDAH
jgi:HAD superfamily hydrolase (TIGR01509 family)